MKSLKYKFSRVALTDDPIEELNLTNRYLQSYKTIVEKQLAPFLKQILEDNAEIELTVAANGREILYWKIINWTPEGYDRLITSNVI